MIYSARSEFFLNFLAYSAREERRFVGRGGLTREYITLNHHIYG
jgi:hypothetical protein